MRVAAACAWLIVAAAQRQQPVPLDARQQSFHEGVARYAALRARLDQALPAFDNPRRVGWTLLLMRRYLASAIAEILIDALPTRSWRRSTAMVTTAAGDRRS